MKFRSTLLLAASMVAAGATLEAKEERGQTPLQLAVHESMPDAVAALEAAGASTPHQQAPRDLSSSSAAFAVLITVNIMLTQEI